MEECSISRLRLYSKEINLDDFIDFAIQTGVLNKDSYCEIWSKPEKHRLDKLFYKVVEKGCSYVKLALDYLNEKVPNINEIINDEENFRKSTIRGNFPKLPPHYVKRESLASVVKQHLQELTWDQPLVIHGMMGYGKSCLVNEVLHDKILRKCFDNYIFWINLGEHQNSDNILQTMLNLYTRACDSPNKVYCPEDILDLKERLKQLFLESRLKNALLILDDVCNTEVLKLFDIGCRTVITTQDKNILRNEAVHLVEVKSGFLLEEAMELFKLSLDTKKDLPVVAEEVYRTCKGHPMLIALIGSYLSENKTVFSMNDDQIWEYIRFMFSKGDYRLNDFDDDVRIPSEKIRTCVDQLLSRKELKSRYMDLAIFMQDVNIPPEVLKILWNTTITDVMHTMNKFAQKSLVVPFYHSNQQRFIYGVHDIHLKYLKEETKDHIQEIHKRLIDNYDLLINGNYAKLPDDNYSFHFIGYHMSEAREFAKFEMYFNLEFLEAKIRAVGKDDVLTDMETYRDLITGKDAALDTKLNHYKEFIRKHGANLYNFPKTSIIQYALQEKKDSCIYDTAVAYAKTSPRLFFKFIRSVSEDLDEFQNINIRDDITCACFVNSVKHILLGFSSGKIKLFYERYEKEISSFAGHSSPIKNLIISPDKSHFLSIGSEGLVKFWKFSDDRRNSIESIGSPKTTQSNWQDLFSPDNGEIQPKKEITQKNDRLVSAAFATSFPVPPYAVTGSKNGCCVVWDLDTGKEVCSIGPRGYEISCVHLSSRDVIFSYDDLINIYKFTTKNNKIEAEYSSALYNKYKVKAFFPCKQEIIAVSHNNIRLWNVNTKKPQDHNLNLEPEEQCLCLALTSDLNYLIFSTEKGKIYFWNVPKKETFKEIKSKGLAKSLDTFYDEDKTFHILLIGSDKRTLQQCYIHPNKDSTELCYTSTPLFVAHWKNNQPFFPLVSSPENKIQVYRGYSLISETDKINVTITRLCLSACGDYVIYGLSTGEIRIFNIKNKTNTKLPPIENRGSIKFLSCYDMDNYSTLNLIDNLNSALDLNVNRQYFSGVVVAVCDNNYLSVHKNHHPLLLSSVDNPVVFSKGDHFILVDSSCKISKLDIRTNSFTTFDSHLEIGNFSVALLAAAFCGQKNYLTLGCKKGDFYYLDLVELKENHGGNHVAQLKETFELEETIKSCCISPDGCLVVAGFVSGNIRVWNMQTGKKDNFYGCHSDSVEQLMFCPSLDPILISLSEEVSWWNFQSFKQNSKPVRTGAFKPKRIEILNVSENECNMDIGFWSNRTPSDGSCLLSCLRLNARPIYLSASSDFNTFLILDEKGKIYIIERLEQS